MQRLAESFAIDVGAYAVMANHLHVVLRQRPDLARDWSAEEVTRRWRHAFPKTRPVADEAPTALSRLLLKAEAADLKLVETRRARLADLSWFMRGLCEPLARRANAEDGCKGRFWEGRFKSVALLDEAAVLACSAYVDLNPVRAGLAKSPETSTYTSAKERIDSIQAAPPKARGKTPPGHHHWLSDYAAEKPGRRSPSRLPWAGIGLAVDLKLLDWTGRRIRSDKPGAIPAELAPILDRLSIRGDAWTDCVRRFGTIFKRSAGSISHLRDYADRRNLRSLHGAAFAARAFG